MSNVIITSVSSPASNITINDSYNTSTSVSSTGGETTIVTVNQGIPGPPGPPGSGIVDIVGGSGIDVSYLSGTYTISSTISGLTGLELASVNNGRITLQSGDPTYYNDISGSTIYYCPYLGNNISLYNVSTSSWQLYSFNEISLGLSSLTTDTNYDIFLYDNGSNLVLERVAWSNNSTRSVALVYQDGVLVKSGSLNKRYIGTIRSTSTNTTEDSASRRFIFNINNKISKILSASDNTTHTYTSSTIRSYRNITTLGLTRTEFIIGLSNQPIDLTCNSVFSTETTTSSVGLSIDSISVFNTSAVNTTYISPGPALVLYNTSSDYITNLNAGYHYIQLLQSGSSITTFYNSSFKSIILC